MRALLWHLCCPVQRSVALQCIGHQVTPNVMDQQMHNIGATIGGREAAIVTKSFNWMLNAYFTFFHSTLALAGLIFIFSSPTIIETCFCIEYQLAGVDERANTATASPGLDRSG